LDSSTPGLIAYWRLDEGSGLVAHDATGHGFEGGLLNGPIWATALNPVDYGMTLAGAPTDTAFRLDLIGQPGRPFVLESSADLLGWAGVLTNQFGVDCRFRYDAPPSSATPVRFYRIVAP
jgi:hypothetical protein